MISRMQERLGTAGLVVACIALVFAMMGGAYAASGGGGDGKATASAKSKGKNSGSGLNGKQKKEVNKIAKKAAKKGPRGAKGDKGDAGAMGPAGAAGRDGLNGLDGLDGTNGQDGSDGMDGSNGVSVTNTAEPAGGNCSEGGTKLEGSSTTYVCNGEQGADGAAGAKGDEGSPWTLGGTLPAGKMLTGAWSFGALPSGFELAAPLTERIYVPLSFPIPLPGELGNGSVHYVKKGESSPGGCTGGSAANPTAEPGNLCIYTQAEDGVGVKYTSISITKAGGTTGGASTVGAVLAVIPILSGGVDMAGAYARGTWAVTAPVGP